MYACYRTNEPRCTKCESEDRLCVTKTFLGRPPRPPQQCIDREEACTACDAEFNRCSIIDLMKLAVTKPQKTTNDFELPISPPSTPQSSIPGRLFLPGNDGIDDDKDRSETLPTTAGSNQSNTTWALQSQLDRIYALHNKTTADHILLSAYIDQYKKDLASLLPPKPSHEVDITTDEVD